VQVSDEIIPVLLVETHKGAAHHDKLDFVCVVTQPFQLFNTVLGLEVGVIAGADGTHGGWLVTRV
jgi:hypothetical protein